MTMPLLSIDNPSDGYSPFHAYRRRFGVLAIFSCLSILQGFAWFTFAPIVGPTKATFPLVTDTTLTLLDAWSPIMYIPMAFVVQYLFNQPSGLQRVVRLGAFLGFCGSVARCLALLDVTSQQSVYCLHLGQMLNGLASPTVVAPPSLLSALWFPPGESTRATAAAVLSNNMGNALAFVVVPYVVHYLGGIQTVFFSLAFCQFLLLCCMPSFPSHPPTPPSAAACTLMLNLGHRDTEDGPSSNGSSLAIGDAPVADIIGKYGKRSGGLVEDIVNMASIPSFGLLCLVYSWSSGAYVSWTSLFDATLTQSRYNDTFIGYLSFGSTLSYIMGGVFSSWLVDKYFPQRMKAVLVISCAASLVITSLFCLSVPSIFSPSRHGIFGMGKGWLLFVAILTGFPNGAAAPIFYEFAAQLTFPISEGSSASALSLFENLGALFLYEVIARFYGAPSLNLIFTLGMGLCCVALPFVREEYRKHDAEDDMTDSIITRMSEGSLSGRSTPLGVHSPLTDGHPVRRVAAVKAQEDTPLLSHRPSPANYGW